MTKRAEFTKDFTRKVVRLAETSGQARKEATEDLVQYCKHPASKSYNYMPASMI
ncbi:hypothetical protein P8H26_14380 [Pseudochrobactrum sp. sp1633]|uniref:hypothetical protein n=1 Tax=Pseudochrobactrum sp. sp1633 TaxID=3036706 RepID=UPI0025A596F6|nr:hypothetical protein [Pseudochrobactrum sp. sp1633]MDM8346577.1 hypothetical protein [Pseudochrobactrum sp. sp1633]HWD12649.1 hypothetical protein [Pseudochrobactrum sp.]